MKKAFIIIIFILEKFFDINFSIEFLNYIIYARFFNMSMLKKDVYGLSLENGARQ
jgi:hypothetical protein